MTIDANSRSARNGTMLATPTTLVRGAHTTAAAVLLALILTLGPTAAAAQQVVARVNGEPITAVDVAQRARLIQLSTHKPAPQKQVLDELIDQLLKIQTAKRYKLEITDTQVDAVLANMAGRMRGNPQQFTQALASAGISVNALKRKIRADLAWTEIVRGKFQSRLLVREVDVAAALERRKTDEKKAVAYEYTLRPILLVVARGGGDGALEARRREADGLRARFQNCDDGLRLARGLKDVVVREPITRATGDLNAKLREVLDSTEVGRLTPPDLTPQGIEVFALCAKKQGKGDTGAERDVREELFGEKFQTEGKQYLQQLRRSAMIEIR